MDVNLTKKNFALFDLYYLLVNRQSVLLEDLMVKYERDMRTIQRYIKDLELLIQYLERQQGFNDNELSRIVYSKKRRLYHLQMAKMSDHTSSLLGMLIQIKSLTPYLSKETIAFIKSTYTVNHVDQYVINQYLENFTTDNEQFPLDLLDLQVLIYERRKLSISYYDEAGEECVMRGISPIRISYQYYHYYLHFYYKNKVHDIKVIDIIDYSIYGEQLTKLEIEEKNPIIVELDKDYYQTFIQSNPTTKKLGKLENGNFKAEIKMSEEDVYFICYRVAPLVKIISPIEYREAFKNKMKRIYDSYNE